ncbi:glucan 1,4-alpha-glucosidase [Pseudoalteromonas sp. SWXJZ94C]|uniref:glycoside hydrolase family 15 protein n=1 Tax=Pseudoalteromonas sp. SWXJZ94C TaxID=2792065 RepID=UPI0018CF7D0C|nr:glycoside hydrolase family 15 protein [Pseudoalteromonas sp. SWXJZ94C]MBH0056963.1 glucan 1,4-alpha-glucosidase [Pseudoalteromonas sp. SWXJZ94C]
MKNYNSITISLLALGLTACGAQDIDNLQTSKAAAPGAPGSDPFWSYAGKTGIGTSYEQYQNGQYTNDASTGTVSKVWFSIAKGMITETMFGLIHQAQIKDMQFVVTGENFTVSEADDLDVTIDYLYKDKQGRPLSLAYKIVSKDKQGRFTLEKHVFTDPDGQSLFVRSVFNTELKDVKAYVVVNPYIDNNGLDDFAKTTDQGLVAWQDDNYLTLQSSTKFGIKTVGFTGISDGLNELKNSKSLNTTYSNTGEQSGNVSMLAELGSIERNTTFDLVLSFGHSEQQSAEQGTQTLAKGYQTVLDNFNGKGASLGWQDYLQSLTPIDKMAEQTADNGKLLYTSAMVLKAQEDKTHAGALIASLSNPWGETVSAKTGSTGYKAVWVRDFYQVAMAFMALGDTATAKTAFEYLEKVQVNSKTPGNNGDSGWFLQKTHVDGELEWVGVQLDQTAMPIMLAWKLNKANVLSDAELKDWYARMLKPAADFLVDGGLAKILWNDTQITPPSTQQERWEEQSGYSPSTTAAVVAGLITAADIAKMAGDTKNAKRYLATAKRYNADIEKMMFTTNGNLESKATDGEYFIRIGQDENANSNTIINANNGREGFNKKQILDGGFLELVRYGVRDALAPSIVKTLPEYDDETLADNLQVKYSFKFSDGSGSFAGYRRYGNDGYGEDEVTGTNYAENGSNTPGQRGRVWPFFTGERGHYEIAAANANNTLNNEKQAEIKNNYVKGLEQFANQGMMLPEQVWDGVGVNKSGYTLGEGTNSATPLAWTHAEYIKLVRSLSDMQVWDYYPVVTEQLK